MTESVILLEPGDERAKKIGKAMASQTANDILSMLKKGDLTLTEISDNMGQPMTTIKYHVENLLDAGLVEVKKIKYSEKGREVKVYGICEQVVIVSAGNKDLRQILMKYASVFGFFVIATLIIGLISSSLFTGSYYSQMTDGSNQYPDYLSSAMLNEANMYGSGEPVYAMAHAPPPDPGSAKSIDLALQQELYNENLTAGMSDTREYTEITPFDNASDVTVHTAVIGFFLGGCAILLLLMLYEAVIWRREKRYWDEKKTSEKNNS
ncbi:MAG: helix-turn-helix transcriptional regulator [Methanomicrobiaceae archaeon]|nr:helix-turn-helix transcriptional regulator [Methanomicrobiaceae archaeon]